MGNSLTALASDLEDFEDLLQQASGFKNLPDSIIEKDYYVVRALRALAIAIKGQFLFKGGTSLSKGWNLLARFSEDIDLLFRSDDGSVRLSRGELDRRLKAADDVLSATPDLVLSATASERGVHRTSTFIYPKRSASLGSVSDTIKLETGIRGGTHPSLVRPIRSYLAEFVEHNNIQNVAEDLSPFSIECLDLRRTAVEKIFAAHGAFQRDLAKRHSRHYYDLYQLLGLSEVQSFLGTETFWQVFDDVKKYSDEFFPKSPAIQRADLRSCPSFFMQASEFNSVRYNYQQSRELYFAEPPQFKEVLDRIQRAFAII